MRSKVASVVIHSAPEMVIRLKCAQSPTMRWTRSYKCFPLRSGLADISRCSSDGHQKWSNADASEHLALAAAATGSGFGVHRHGHRQHVTAHQWSGPIHRGKLQRNRTAFSQAQIETLEKGLYGLTALSSSIWLLQGADNKLSGPVVDSARLKIVMKPDEGQKTMSAPRKSQALCAFASNC
jgi:hypothetical protein